MNYSSTCHVIKLITKTIKYVVFSTETAYSFIVMVASLSIDSTRYKRKARPSLTFGIEMSLVDINLSLDNELKQSSSTHCGWNRL